MAVPKSKASKRVVSRRRLEQRKESFVIKHTYLCHKCGKPKRPGMVCTNCKS